MRIIRRVALLHQSSVSGTKARFFPFVPGLLLAARAGIVAPALALMVHRRRKGRHYVQQPALPQPQAKVHVIVRYGEIFFVQPAEAVVKLFFHHQARARHRAHILRGRKAVHIAAAVPRVALMAVSGAAAQTDEYARVLDGSVGVKKLRAHGSHVRPLRIRQQLPHEAGRFHLDVVIQQQQVCARGMPRAAELKAAENVAGLQLFQPARRVDIQ